jgi:AraC-like DNA-binding protein
MRHEARRVRRRTRGADVMSSVVEARDLDAALALLSGARQAVRVRGDPVALRLAHNHVGPVGIDQVTSGFDLDVDLSPADLLVFGQVKSGGAGVSAAGAERWYGPGDVYLAGQPGQWCTAMIRAGEQEQAVIDPALIAKVAETAPDRPGPVRFTGYAAGSRHAAGLWESTYAYVRGTVLASPAAADHPLLAASAARLLAVTVLAVFPNDARADPTAADRHDGSPATLRRAVTFIDEHAHEDIAAADIAGAAFVTIRAIQLAFRRHLGTTPMEYLRRVRLDHAHRQLVAADPREESVTDVAYQWGFPSPSRFAAAYRKAYGVLPSHSLRD